MAIGRCREVARNQMPLSRTRIPSCIFKRKSRVEKATAENHGAMLRGARAGTGEGDVFRGRRRLARPVASGHVYLGRDTKVISRRDGCQPAMDADESRCRPMEVQPKAEPPRPRPASSFGRDGWHGAGQAETNSANGVRYGSLLLHHLPS